MLEIDYLSEDKKILLNRLFGKKSEKTNRDQLHLFEQEEEDEDEDEEQVIPTHTRRKSKKNRQGRPAFPAHLPREEFHCELSGDDLSCPDCEAELKRIGEDICERGHIVPAKIIVRRFIKGKYACPNGHVLKTAEAPAAVVPRVKYEPSVYAHIAVSRFGDHLPYTRQESIFKRQGFAIPRSTMGDMMQRLGEIAGEPILKQMLKELLTEDVVQADETTITVLKEGQKGTLSGYMWVYRSPTKVLFDFTIGRESLGPTTILALFFGILQIDSYSGYNEIVIKNSLIRAGCWSHARRKFHDALKSNKKHGAAMLSLIGRLFRIEAILKWLRVRRHLCDDDFFALRVAVRTRYSKPVIEKIETRLLDVKAMRSILPKSAMGKAVKYAWNQRETLKAFIEHGCVELDNNAAERAIRQVAVGRKNYMFAGSVKGGKTAAILYSLIGSCKVLGINPQAYLEDVLMKVAITPQSEAHTLTLWGWQKSQAQNSIANLAD